MYLHAPTLAAAYWIFGIYEFPCTFSPHFFEIILWGFIVVTIIGVIILETKISNFQKIYNGIENFSFFENQSLYLIEIDVKEVGFSVI